MITAPVSRFSASDRTHFAAFGRCLGMTEPFQMQSFLLDGVWNESDHRPGVRQLLDGVRPRWLRRAGRRELAAWLAMVDRRARRRLRVARTELQGIRPEMDETLMNPKALHSLQTVLFQPVTGQLDLMQRAGFHRLARALLDVHPEELRQMLVDWPEAYRRFLCRAHHAVRAAGLDPARAGQLRSQERMWRSVP